MAPSYANADLTYRQAVSALTFACKQLECHLPSDDITQADNSLNIPPHRPQQRGESVSVCPECVVELDQLEPGARDGHQCTHNVDDGVDQGSGLQRDVRMKLGTLEGKNSQMLALYTKTKLMSKMRTKYLSKLYLP